MEHMKERGQLHARMNKIRATVSHVEKSGKNTMQNYNYATEADTVHAIRKAMVEHGVSLHFSSVINSTREIQGNNKVIPVVCVRLSGSWVDCETGYAEPFEFDGEGMDSGDKAVYKAHTGAEKYLLLKTFLVPTGDDPERDEEVQRAKVDKAHAEAEKQPDHIDNVGDKKNPFEEEIEHILGITNMVHLTRAWTKLTAKDGAYWTFTKEQQDELTRNKDNQKAKLKAKGDM